MAARHVGFIGSFPSFCASTTRPTRARRLVVRLAIAALPAVCAGLGGVLASPIAPRAAFAQMSDAPPEIEKGNYQVQGQLVDGAYLHSGPGENFYLTQHLNAGTVVTVVGKKGNWLVIEPPEGSFSYVSKQFIHRYGDGTKGQVQKPNQIVHAGSVIQPQLQWAVQSKLDAGQEVTILADENPYYKIKPPQGAYLFIEREHVHPLPKKPETPAPTPPGSTGNPTNPTNPGNGSGEDPGPVARHNGSNNSNGSATGGVDGGGVDSGSAHNTPTPPDAAPEPRQPRTRPAGTPSGQSDVATHGGSTGSQNDLAAPSTRPAFSESLARLQKLESEFTAASSQPLPEQPIEALLAGYEDLASSPGVPEPTRKMADARARTLKVRAQVRDNLATVEQKQTEDHQKIESLNAERRELEANIKKLDMHVYTAVGTLRPSSLQVGNGGGHTTLYRLTDPSTGGTLIYLRTNDPRFADLIGQFVGINGPVGTESQLNLKVITPTAVEGVDPSKVNNNVAAQIVPPSMLPKAPAPPTTPTASSGQ